MAGRYPNGDFYDFESELPAEEKEILYRVREWAQEKVLPIAVDHWNRSEFPHELLPSISELNIISLVRGQGRSRLLAGLVTAEIHRADGSVGTFLSGQDGLFTGSIELLGSEEQKERWLDDLYAVRKTGVLAITEPEAGSDVAQGMRTTATKVDGGWVLNGAKRWIGNATFSDYVAVYARDPEDEQVKGFIVDTTAEGYTATLMENRIAIRAVQNADITLDNVFVPDSDKLEGANSFKDINKVFKSARSTVGWQAVGTQMGALDVALGYADERIQFGKKISSFQLNQNKLATMQGNLVASESMMAQLARMEDRGSANNEQSALAKAFTSKLMRESVALGREIMGGNGLISDYRMAKIFNDAEAIYSYEGTYDINQLIVGRAITGESAFV
ncbi:acyl-CoA dehydrogenase family protein [Corynebacterium sp. CNCTC7651]|uniref:acyl-CoA dehydrogenase family protein n=1 Tax=Corynebacterium sp. CNCTC7651 TaxID=2815361 RepID=UPI001F1E52B4|nr:acyl-CoA dehydrogenase family protein [Corynebacterium sp. CNCTC7651]UIZ92054.1 acyl-CoA dehydrogenase family protein [Corynebacterium sp. CNCTC7651]